MAYKDKKIKHLELENAELRMVLRTMVEWFPVDVWEVAAEEHRKQKVIIQSLFRLDILESPNNSDDADLPVCIRCGIDVPKSATGGRRKPMCGKCYLLKKKQERSRGN